MSGPTQEQEERARLAAANRTEDPLANWTRLQNEECPICMLPLPHEVPETKYCVTCGKTVCWGCLASVAIAHRRDGGDMKTALEKINTCPFCRSSTTATSYDKSLLENEMKLANAGNHYAMCHLGKFYFDGEMGLEQDKAEGLRWYHRAVEVGSGTAAWIIGNRYDKGDGVEQDTEKAVEYYQKSAELGHVYAFLAIGSILIERGEIEESMLNYRKTVMCGMSDDGLFEILRNGFREGFITKDEYAFTLRENQKACNEMKSDGRERWKNRKSRNASR